jgi:broad specificity polyphosphatase/5'/3'-nucleotidase SurE
VRYEGEVRILVTNDDGIDADGLHVLAERLTKLDHGEVVVAAPIASTRAPAPPWAPCT